MAPLDSPVVRYADGQVDNVVSRLQKRLNQGDVKLKYEDELGYLRSVLQELGVSASSQVLVFSKTSFQSPRIGPRTPHAIYFTDNIAVGFVRTGDVLELAALDPKQGIVFYTLDQERSSHPGFERRDVCLQCHQSASTMGIPGLMVRSVTTGRDGVPILSEGSFITDHRSPVKERWGGWYVSGTAGSQTHRGNAVIGESVGDGVSVHAPGNSNVTDLRHYFDTGAYLTPHSDIVALMTLEHQTQMDNLMIRVGWEARLAMADNAATNKSLGKPEEQIRPSIQHRIDTAAEDLVQYMLFTGDARWADPIQGSSGFTEEFTKKGPTDSKGRSLRDFDLKTHLFRYSCSFMIYSEAFDGMPAIVRDRVYKRIYESADPAVIAILRETKKGLPAYWS